MRLPAPCICAVTDRRRLAPDARTVGAEVAALERFLDEVIGAGADLIQIRERDLEAARLRDVTARAVSAARGRGPVIVVNDRLDVAVAARADGVHLPHDGLPVAGVRALAPDALVGRSIHSLEEARGSPAPDYLLFGTIFASESKTPGAPVQGLERLTLAVDAAPCPVLAIGGIDPARARQCRQAGATGVAAIGVFLPEGRSPQALGPARAVRELRAALLAAG
jgi:thiamine-phosphate diphosphorylase